MGKEYISLEMVLNMKGIGISDLLRDMEREFIIMEILMKVIGLIMKEMDKENTFGMINHNLRVIFKIIKFKTQGY